MLNNEEITKIIDQSLQSDMAFGDLLSSQNREFIINNSQLRTADVGEILCRQNENEYTLFLIVEGQVEVTLDIKGETLTLGIQEGGELVGEIGALYMLPRTATVTVLQSAAILEIPAEVCYDLVSEHPDLRDLIKKTLSGPCCCHGIALCTNIQGIIRAGYQ